MNKNFGAMVLFLALAFGLSSHAEEKVVTKVMAEEVKSLSEKSPQAFFKEMNSQKWFEKESRQGVNKTVEKYLFVLNHPLATEKEKQIATDELTEFKKRIESYYLSQKYAGRPRYEYEYRVRDAATEFNSRLQRLDYGYAFYGTNPFIMSENGLSKEAAKRLVKLKDAELKKIPQGYADQVRTLEDSYEKIIKNQPKDFGERAEIQLGYFRNAIRKYIANGNGPGMYESELKLYTTLNSELTAGLERALNPSTLKAGAKGLGKGAVGVAGGAALILGAVGEANAKSKVESSTYTPALKDANSAR